VAVPLCLLRYRWYVVLGAVVFADLFWAGIRCYFTSPTLANAGDTLVRFLKWPLALSCGVILFIMEKYAECWPCCGRCSPV
jgi:hypothetical protein